MSYQATVFNVMIAAPGDVEKELDIIKEAVHDWNAANSESQKIVLMPTHWQSHAAPDMGRPAQEIINQQVLNKCDLLVGVFWTRIGTPTDGYASGTVEEIKRHVEARKPAMVYFSDCQATPSKVDAEQKAAVDEFKRWCEKHGLYATYNDRAKFEVMFAHHLQLKIDKHSRFKNARAIASGNSKPATPQLSEAARDLLKAACDNGGGIIRINTMRGTDIQVRGISIPTSTDDEREFAKWDAALEELTNKGLLKAKGSKGQQIFEVTHKGYETHERFGDKTGTE